MSSVEKEVIKYLNGEFSYEKEAKLIICYYHEISIVDPISLEVIKKLRIPNDYYVLGKFSKYLIIQNHRLKHGGPVPSFSLLNYETGESTETFSGSSYTNLIPISSSNFILLNERSNLSIWKLSSGTPGIGSCMSPEKIIKIRSFSCGFTISFPDKNDSSLYYDSNYKLLLVVVSNVIRGWNLSDLKNPVIKLNVMIPDTSSLITRSCFQDSAADRRLSKLLTCHKNGDLQIWDFGKNAKKPIRKLNIGEVKCIATLDDTKYAVVTKEFFFQVWDSESDIKLLESKEPIMNDNLAFKISINKVSADSLTISDRWGTNVLITIDWILGSLQIKSIPNSTHIEVVPFSKLKPRILRRVLLRRLNLVLPRDLVDETFRFF